MGFSLKSPEKLKNRMSVGNIHNNCVNVKGFVSELEPILSDLSSTNSEVLICGDYNINLNTNPEDKFWAAFQLLFRYNADS